VHGRSPLSTAVTPSCHNDPVAQTAILHFDLDAFHESVQKLLDPSLRISPAAWCRGAHVGTYRVVSGRLNRLSEPHIMPVMGGADVRRIVF